VSAGNVTDVMLTHDNDKNNILILLAIFTIPLHTALNRYGVKLISTIRPLDGVWRVCQCALRPVQNRKPTADNF